MCFSKQVFFPKLTAMVEWQMQVFNMAAFLTIVFDRRLQMWLVGYVTLCIDCQTPVTPINEGIHTVWSFSATIRAMDAAQETVKRTPESFCEIWLDSHILEVCAAMRVNEWSRVQKTPFSTAAIDFKQGCQEQMTSCPSIWNDGW